MKRSIAASALVAVCTCAIAQDSGREPRLPAVAEPARPSGGSKPPALPWRSAFEGYRPYAEEPPVSWRESNDTVGRLGGHAGHLQDWPRPGAARPPAAPAAGGVR